MDPSLYPKNKLIIDGTDIADRFAIFMSDNYSLGLPAPKTTKVDIPGSGSLDLTESLFGDVAYENRTQEFAYYMLAPYDEYTEVLTKVANFLHGKRFDYRLTMDDPYIYTGRFTIESNTHTPGYYISRGPTDVAGTFKIKIDADPWKLREKKLYSLNACGGKLYHFESGRKPVRPMIQTDQVTTVVWRDKVIEVPEGSYILNDVLFTEGVNELYINSYPLQTIKWEDLGEGGDNAMTWTQAGEYRWDGLHRLKVEGDVIRNSWDDFSESQWLGLQTQNIHDNQRWLTWDDMNYKPDTSSGHVYISYEWKDL